MEEAALQKPTGKALPASYYVFGDALKAGMEAKALGSMYTLVHEPSGVGLAWRQVFLTAAVTGTFLFGQNVACMMWTLYATACERAGRTPARANGVNGAVVAAALALREDALAPLISAVYCVCRLNKCALVDQAIVYYLTYFDGQMPPEDLSVKIEDTAEFIAYVLADESTVRAAPPSVAQAAICMRWGVVRAYEASAEDTYAGEARAVMYALVLLARGKANVAWRTLEYVCTQDARYAVYDASVRAIQNMAGLVNPRQGLDKSRVFLVAAIMTLTRVAPIQARQHVVDTGTIAKEPLSHGACAHWMAQREASRARLAHRGADWLVERGRQYSPIVRKPRLEPGMYEDYAHDLIALVAGQPATTREIVAGKDFSLATADMFLESQHGTRLRALSSSVRMPKRRRTNGALTPLSASTPRTATPAWFPTAHWLVHIETEWEDMFLPAAHEALVRVAAEDYRHYFGLRAHTAPRLPDQIIETKASLVLKGPVSADVLKRLAARDIVERVTQATSLPQFYAFCSGSDLFLLIETSAADSGSGPPRKHARVDTNGALFSASHQFVLKQIFVCYMLGVRSLDASDVRVGDHPVRTNLMDAGRPSEANMHKLETIIHSRGMTHVLGDPLLRRWLADLRGAAGDAAQSIETRAPAAVSVAEMMAAAGTAADRLEALLAEPAKAAKKLMSAFFMGPPDTPR